jgi:hypothetical protein
MFAASAVLNSKNGGKGAYGSEGSINHLLEMRSRQARSRHPLTARKGWMP